jgi:hypothetical protein
MEAGEVPVKWQSWIALITGGNIQIKNEKRRFHLVPGVNERLIANALSDQSEGTEAHPILRVPVG